MKTLNNNKYATMLVAASKNLENHKSIINDLNVFPVPDGDTGINMCMTMSSGISKISDQSHQTVGELSLNFSKGLLLGARGNSGVILSQFFRGIGERLKEEEIITIENFTQAMSSGVESAYKSVIRPVEGTILTVAKDLAKSAHDHHKTSPSFEDFFTKILEDGHISLENTPNLLPILKEAGVVDSGGQGLIYIFEGMLKNLLGEEISQTETIDYDSFREKETHSINVEDIIYRHCTEMLVKLNNPGSFDLASFINKVESFGDSLVAINDGDVLKCHIHTETPLQVFQLGLDYGDLIGTKTENMRIQAEEAQKSIRQTPKKIGIVAVTPSDELTEILNSITQVTAVSGGQTSNPSTEDIVKACEQNGSKEIIIFPNNSNIIMAANAARDLLKDKIKVSIIKTKYLTQCIECLYHFHEDITLDENIKVMEETIEDITNIEITQSIRQTTIGGVAIKKDDYMLIINGKITFANSNVKKVMDQVLSTCIDEDTEIVRMIQGRDGDDKLIQEYAQKIAKIDEMIDVIIQKGAQPTYPYLISIL